MYRFSPSLTEDLNIETLRIALFNFICAKRANEKFIVRFEDSEKENNFEAKDREIQEILTFFGITYDQVIYQSENLKFHRLLGSKLLMDGNAFSCFCTDEILETKREQSKNDKTAYHYDGTCKKLSNDEVMANESPFVIRVKNPSKSIKFSDLIKGEMKFEPENIDDFIILRVDKTPTYDFACSVDDMLSNISVIIRADKYRSNTPKQELIRQYLGYTEKVEYAHLPVILNNTSVNTLLEEGFLPNAIINYLILMGNKTPTKIFTLQDAIEWFELKNISKEPMQFDIEKLRELNREHIKLLNPLELSKFIGYSSKDIGELAKVFLEEASTINEIKVKIDAIFAIKTCENFIDEFKILKKASKDLPYFKEFDEFKASLADMSGLKERTFLKLLRVLLTGAESGPSLSEIYPHIKNYLGEIIK